MIGSNTIFVTKNKQTDLYLCGGYLVISLQMVRHDPQTSFEIMHAIVNDLTPTRQDVSAVEVDNVAKATHCNDPAKPGYSEYAGDSVFKLDLDAGTLQIRSMDRTTVGLPRHYEWKSFITDNDKVLAAIDPRHLHMFKLAMSQISINLPVFTIINRARGELVGTSVVYVPTTNGFYKLTQKPVPTEEDKLAVDFRDLSFSTHVMVPYSELMASLPPRRN